MRGGIQKKKPNSIFAGNHIIDHLEFVNNMVVPAKPPNRSNHIENNSNNNFLTFSYMNMYDNITELTGIDICIQTPT